MMTWAYIAGYFDGEGTAWLGKRGASSRNRICLSWFNTHLGSLEQIRDFIGFGTIRVKKKYRDHHLQAYALVISRRDDVIAVCDQMIPHSIIKRERLEDVRRAALQMRSESTGRGALSQAGADHIRHLYWSRGMNMRAIADTYGVTISAVKNFMKSHEIPARTRSESSSGFKHSLETRKRMGEIKARQWANPAMRANMQAGIALAARSRAH